MQLRIARAKEKPFNSSNYIGERHENEITNFFF